jgi:hypothetical protein
MLAMKAYAYSLRSGSYQPRRVFWGLVEGPPWRERAHAMQQYNCDALVHVHRNASFQSASTKLSVSISPLPFLFAVFNFAQDCSCPSRHPCLSHTEPCSACAPGLWEGARVQRRDAYGRDAAPPLFFPLARRCDVARTRLVKAASKWFSPGTGVPKGGAARQGVVLADFQSLVHCQ